MIRQTVRSFALAVAGLLLAGVAWAQDPVLRQVTSAAQLLASEHFGGEPRVVSVSKMDLDGATEGVQRPYVGLNVQGAGVSPGNVAEITFTLAGATFDQAATPGNLDQRGADCAGTAGTNLKVSVVSGGARGDNAVTFRAETAGETALAVDTTAICFWVPDLSVTLAPSGMNRVVDVTAAIKATTNVGVPFPGTVNGNNVNAEGMATPDNNTGEPGPITAKTILQAAEMLTADLGMGGTGQVNVSDRTKIASGGKPDPSVVGAGAKTTGLLLGTLSIRLSTQSIWKLDGSGPLSGETIDASLSGQVKLSVGGQFQSGDMVVYGSGATALKAAISGGMAELSVPIAVGSKELVYVPGGVDVLTPGTFTTGAAYLFNDRRNNNAMITPMVTADVRYLGINVEGYAYGVVRGAGTESSIGRVTCESAATGSCAIFVDCTDQAGMDYFGAAPPIPVGQTSVWNSDDLAGVLGGGWASGRGSCDIHSNGQLSVQHMVRTGSGLINNSAVVGRGLDEGEEAAREAQIEAVKAVVDNICRSVGDESTGTDRDTTADGTQHTVCWPAGDWRTRPAG